MHRGRGGGVRPTPLIFRTHSLPHTRGGRGDGREGGGGGGGAGGRGGVRGGLGGGGGGRWVVFPVLALQHVLLDIDVQVQ